MSDALDISFLEEVGLSSSEAALYRVLINRGPQSAAELSKRSGLSRTNTYNVLAALEARGLIARSGGGRKTLFAPLHPRRLERLLDAQEEAVRRNRARLGEQMQHLVADFSLAEQRPGVFRFEGKAGIIRVYEELIADRVTVNSIVDRAILRAVIAEYNPEYVRRRVRNKIRSRVITPASAPCPENNERELREVRYFDADRFPFQMDLKITSKKLVMTTFAEENVIGVIVIDEEIVRNFSVLFEFLWQLASAEQPDSARTAPDPALRRKV